MDNTSLTVIGSLHTDIIATGLKRFPQPGELVKGAQLTIGPGGKSRNIAAMAGVLLGEWRVAMISLTAQDAFGLWKPPVEALQVAGVQTDFIRIIAQAEATKLPAMALIPVTESGENQIIVLPGVSEDFSPQDIDAAEALYQKTADNHGFLAVTLECPLATAVYSVQKASSYGIRVIFDPGGIESADQAIELMRTGVYLIKPNEHEAKLITGITVTDLSTAQQAAAVLRQKGAQNVLITHGENGAYLIADSTALHIQTPDLHQTGEKDATGCGDQTMAALCALLNAGYRLETASKVAVAAGSLQFHRAGIQPISMAELEPLLQYK